MKRKGHPRQRKRKGTQEAMEKKRKGHPKATEKKRNKTPKRQQKREGHPRAKYGWIAHMPSFKPSYIVRPSRSHPRTQTLSNPTPITVHRSWNSPLKNGLSDTMSPFINVFNCSSVALHSLSSHRPSPCDCFSNELPSVIGRNLQCQPVRGVNFREECHWSHAW
jgi:hypothetical protein